MRIRNIEKMVLPNLKAIHSIFTVRFFTFFFFLFSHILKLAIERKREILRKNFLILLHGNHELQLFWCWTISYFFVCLNKKKTIATYWILYRIHWIEANRKYSCKSFGHKTTKKNEISLSLNPTDRPIRSWILFTFSLHVRIVDRERERGDFMDMPRFTKYGDIILCSYHFTCGPQMPQKQQMNSFSYYLSSILAKCKPFVPFSTPKKR